MELHFSELHFCKIGKRCLGVPPNASQTFTSDYNASLNQEFRYGDAINYTCIPEWYFSDGLPVRYVYVRLLSGYCQVTVRLLSGTVRYCQVTVRYCQVTVKYCQVQSGYCQVLSGTVRLLSGYCQVLSGYCQVLLSYCQVKYCYLCMCNANTCQSPAFAMRL